MRSAASPRARGALLGKTAAELKAVKFKDTPERMMSLGDLCALVAGRVPLVIEVKSHFDGDRKLVTRMAEVLASYSGPAVGMSFDPDQVLALRELMPSLAARHRRRARLYRRRLAEASRRTAPRHAASAPCLPHPAAFRRLLGRRFAGARALDRPQHLRLPLLTWTVRTPEQRARAARYADQMIFEGFVPGT